ncbi:MAG: hypothetical protein HY900_02940, partial [Deltaproteobacteria bacterium]|nr:hypothetical protein [Deltaproteobacteria bacterium]
MKRALPITFLALLVLLSLAGAAAAELPAPVLKHPENGATVYGHVVHFEWESAGGPGVTYHIQVTDMDHDVIVWDEIVPDRSVQFLLYDAYYSWHVSAIDPAGVEGPNSPEWYFRVVEEPNEPPKVVVTFPNGEDTAPPIVAVQGPDGGEVFFGGSDITITWEVADDLTPPALHEIRVSVSPDGGYSWATIAELQTNPGSILWSAPNIDCDQCLIRVSAMDLEFKVAVDTSDSPFIIISNLDLPSESVYPEPDRDLFVRGEALKGGFTYPITWIAADDLTPAPDLKIGILFSPDNGANWEEIARLDDNPGAFDWTTPNITSNECLIKVTATDDGRRRDEEVPQVPHEEDEKTGVDVSDAVFTIVYTPPLNTVPSSASSLRNVVIQSLTSHASYAEDSYIPVGAPVAFRPARAVSYGLTAVAGTADLTMTFPSLPVKPTFYHVVNGAWRQLYPNNEGPGVRDVVLIANKLSYSIIDNEGYDADPMADAITTQVVVGEQPSAPVTVPGA